MTNCTSCNQPLGFFRGISSKNICKKCESLHKQANNEIISLVGNEDLRGGDLEHLKTSVEKIAAANRIDNATLDTLIFIGLERILDKALEDKILLEEEEEPLYMGLERLADCFSISKERLKQGSLFAKLVKNATLRDVFNEKIPERVNVVGSIPFNMQKTEKLVWLFKNVHYCEQKTRTQYVGGSQGVSIRIAKGLWYRANAFKGERVQTSETVQVDTGYLGVTNKHLYFTGSTKGIRINYGKIVAFKPYLDGIGVQKDGVNAKTQIFITNDAQFTYNLITNLARM